MAVFKQELNWSTYQDKQLKVLESLERSFSSSVRTSKLIEDNLSNLKNSIESMVSATRSMADAIYSLNPQRKREEESSRNYVHMMNQSADAMKGQLYVYERYAGVIDHTARLEAEKAASMEKSLRLEEELREANRRREEIKRAEAERAQREKAEHDDAILKVLDKASDIMMKAGKMAENYSELSNSLIRISGAGGDNIRSIKNDIVNDITSELNRDTGDFYNPQEVYKQMVSIASSAGIGSLDTLKELTRPVMLAQESMDVNIREMSVLLGRWHTRYRFSSSEMEDIVNDIRGSTAGNQATAEATLENMASLDNWMAYYAKGDTDKMTEMSKSISEGTAWLESMNVDTARYTDYISSIASGNAATDTQLIQVLRESGLSALEAQQMFASGDIDNLYKALFQGESSIFGRLSSSGTNLLSQSLSARGMDVSQMVDVYNASTSKTFTNLEDFLQTIDPTTAAEAVEDKYINATDKINNHLEKIYNVLANVQEHLGFGLSDIAGLYILTKGVKDGIGVIGSAFPKAAGVLSKIGGVLGAGGSAGGAGIAAAGTAALPIAAAVVGLVGAASSIYDIVKESKEDNAQHLSNLIEVTKNLKEDKVAMMQEIISVDDKGNIVRSYSTEMVSPDEYNPEKHLENLQKAREQDLDQYKPNDFWKEAISAITLTGSDYSNWYDFIPIVGGIGQVIEDAVGTNRVNKNYDRETQYTEFLNSLSNDEKRLASAYAGANLITSLDQLEFMVNNWDKIVSLHDQGLAVQLSKNGINSPVDSMQLIGYETGTNYIMKNQLALLHEGEAVTPKRYNPMANLNELESLREQNRRDEGNSETYEYLKASVDTLIEIKEYLSFWKEDNVRREAVTESKNKFKTGSWYLSNYTVPNR